MSQQRSFAALIDQDSVVVLEYQQEKAGFKIVDTRERNRRFQNPEAAADAVVELLAEMKARNPSLSIVLQHFGAFFHTMVMPPAADDVVRPIIVREVQRSFNIADPVIAYSTGASVERRETPRGGQIPRHIFIAGAPRSVIEALHARLTRAKIRVEGMTVVPEVFRRLYDTLDGSTEATAVLICLHNGPHVAFFVNGQLELAIEPPLSLEGEAPLDTSVIVDQLERGAIFLRQQARGTVATRLLLSAPAADGDHLASTIEARTGMRVARLGHGVGTPESVVAMGSVLAARGEDKLDIYPRAPGFDVRLKSAMSGPGLVTTTLMTAAAVAAFWAIMQVGSMHRMKSDIASLQSQVERGLPAVATARESARGRERIAGIRTALAAARDDRSAVADLLSEVASASQPGTRLDSVAVVRVEEGLQARVFGVASAATGPAAMGSATAFYRHFRQRPGFKSLDFESSYAPRLGQESTGEELKFIVSFVSPTGAR